MSFQRQLKVLHTVESYALDAEDKSGFVRRLSESLVKRGHEVTVATSSVGGFTEPELEGVRILPFDLAGSLSLGRRGRDLSRYQDVLFSSSADVMLNYGAETSFTDLAFPVVEKTRLRQLNIFASNGFFALNSMGHTHSNAFTEYYRQVLPRILPLYDASIYSSREGEDFHLAQTLELPNVTVVPPGISDEEFMEKPPIDVRKRHGINTPYLGLGIAKIYDYTGIDRIIGCLRTGCREDLTVCIVVWGPKNVEKHPPQFRDLMQAASKLRTPVRFVFNPPRPELLALYFAADIFFYGTELEPDGIPVFEARASRTPFVSVDYPVIRGLSGGIVCHQDDMWQACNTILDNPLYRQLLADEGWKDWREKYTWAAVVDTVEELYFKRLVAVRFEAEIAAGQKVKREVVRRIAKRFGDYTAYLVGATTELRAGHFTEAKAYLEDASQIRPENEALRKLLSQVRRRSMKSASWIDRHRLQ